MRCSPSLQQKQVQHEPSTSQHTYLVGLADDLGRHLRSAFMGDDGFCCPSGSRCSSSASAPFPNEAQDPFSMTDEFIVWASEMDMRIDALRLRTEQLRMQLQSIEQMAADLVKSSRRSPSSTDRESESPLGIPHSNSADASRQVEASLSVVFASSDPGEGNNE